MRTRRIGSLEVSVVGLGCNNFGFKLDEAATARVVHAAIDAGVTFLDTADIYGDSEVLLGRVLRSRRQQVVLATKFGYAGNTRAGEVAEAVDNSLRRLQTDRIDLLQVHKPNPAVPIAETLGALGDAVRGGKVREIGCSNFSAAQIREAEAAAGDGARFVSAQNELSLLHRDAEREVLPECARLGLAFLPYFPLANGILTGKYGRGRERPVNTRLTSGPMADRLTEDAIARADRLAAFAASRGHSLLELAFGWLLSFRSIASVIAGATSEDQVRGNVAAAAWDLTPDEVVAVSQLV
jgi:aryl-alcohol dehydrogenase-like predicted oxidoreductase